MKTIKFQCECFMNDQSTGNLCYVVFRFFVEDISKYSIDLHYPPESRAESAWNAIHFMSNYAAHENCDDRTHLASDQRIEKKLTLFSWSNFWEMKENFSDDMKGESETMENVSSESSDKAMFYSGHPDIEKTRGYLHLYRTSDSYSIEDIDTKMLVVLAIRATVGIDQLLSFIQVFTDDIQKLQILFQTENPFYMAFILFFDSDKCKEFYTQLNGQAFSSLEPELTCQCAFVREISTHCKQKRNYLSQKELNEAENLQELPQCIICLERMDESVDGVLTGPCNHEFHLSCLKQYKSTDCPVCRYSLVPDAQTYSECLQCGATDDLWLCLICGFIGCGRYLNKHAVEHFEISNHTFAKQLGSERVWDYVRDQYVHRLIQNKGDGKLVEYTVEAPFQVPNNGEEFEPSERDIRGETVTVSSDEKLDSIQIEYSYLISSELDKQRVYYEEKLKHMEIEAKNKELQLEGRLKGVMDEKIELEKEVTQMSRTKSALEKKISDLKTKLEISEKVRKAKFEDVDEMNKSLLANQNELKSQLAKLEQEKKEMEETNRDLMFTLSAQLKVSEMTSDEKDELSAASIHVASPESSSKASGGARPKRKTNKR